MTFEHSDLPYSYDALEPHVGAETLELHHGKHHAGYVETLNELLDSRGESPDDLESLIRTAQGAVFQNAAQAWNHDFLWKCMSPDGGGEPPTKLSRAIEDAFGDVESFRDAFDEAAKSHFGSGWAWLVQTKEGRLEVVTTQNADNPMRMMRTPLLVCDLWEHAYYLDHRNDRDSYLEAFWRVVDWEAVEQRLVWTAEHASAASEDRS